MQRYYLPLAGLVVVVLLLRHFRRSRQAMALLLIRTSAHAAESFGIRRSWARLSCMALSAAIAAIGGSLLAFSSSTVSPNSFTLWTSIFLLVGSVVSLYSLSLVGALVWRHVPHADAAAAGQRRGLDSGSCTAARCWAWLLGFNALPPKLQAKLQGGKA